MMIIDILIIVLFICFFGLGFCIGRMSVYQKLMSFLTNHKSLDNHVINSKDIQYNSKPNPYMPYEYCSTQLKSDTENNDLVYVPVGGTISAKLYNIIKDKLRHGIEYHECDGTRIDKKEYETLYDLTGHNYDDVGDNTEVSDFRLPNVKGWYIRIK